MTAGALLADLQNRGVRLAARGKRLAYDAPAGVMTPDLLAAVKAHKPELLGLLAPAGISKAEPLDGTHADHEWARFMAACRPSSDGRGWYDPAQAPALENLVQADARAAEPPTQRQPDRDADGLTAVERGERWRTEWAANGYPPGVQPIACVGAQ